MNYLDTYLNNLFCRIGVLHSEKYLVSVFRAFQAGMRAFRWNFWNTRISTKMCTFYWFFLIISSHHFLRYWQISVEISCFVYLAHWSRISTFSNWGSGSLPSKIFRFKRKANGVLSPVLGSSCIVFNQRLWSWNGPCYNLIMTC